MFLAETRVKKTSHKIARRCRGKGLTWTNDKFFCQLWDKWFNTSCSIFIRLRKKRYWYSEWKFWRDLFQINFHFCTITKCILTYIFQAFYFIIGEGAPVHFSRLPPNGNTYKYCHCQNTKGGDILARKVRRWRRHLAKLVLIAGNKAWPLNLFVGNFWTPQTDTGKQRLEFSSTPDHVGWKR